MTAQTAEYALMCDLPLRIVQRAFFICAVPVKKFEGNSKEILRKY
jgi:hypothetical protein